MNVIRAFIAIDLTAEITQKLEQVLAELKARLPANAIRWVAAQNIHLTIKFLGDVAIHKQGPLTKILQTEASRHAAFDIQVGELGVFPNLRRPHVVWIGVKAPPELVVLQNGVESGMAQLGYPPEERPFSPHLTLGRVSRNASPDELRRISDALSKRQVDWLGEVHVQAVHLYRSDLQPGGSIYTRLFTANLAEG